MYKTKREAMVVGRNALKKMNFVSGVRGGKIPKSQARITTIRTLGGYVPIAKRRN